MSLESIAETVPPLIGRASGVETPEAGALRGAEKCCATRRSGIVLAELCSRLANDGVDIIGMPDEPTLEFLAGIRFGGLSEAETTFVRAAPTGEFAVCGPKPDENDPANDPAYDPSKADAEWKEDRTIRADLIRWVCVDRQARDLVDPRGVQIYGAKVKDALDLSFATIPFALTLWNCRLTGETNLRDTSVSQVDFQFSWVDFIAADRATVKTSVFFRRGFHAARGIRLSGAQIGSNLECDGSVFGNPPEQEPAVSGDVLNMEGAIVGGDVFLRGGFKANGDVKLTGAQIGADLNCTGATFAGMLLVERAAVKGTLFWTDVNVPPKPVPTGGSPDAPAVSSNAANAQVRLDLLDASVGSLVDDSKSWPSAGDLLLDGFVYGRFSFDAPKDATSRLDWLGRQFRFRPQPYRQLAKVLREEGDAAGARRVLFEMERLRRSDEARKRWRVPKVDNDPPKADDGPQRFTFNSDWLNRGVLASITWDETLRWTIGYGYYPGRALVWLLLIVALGWPVFRHGYFSGNMAPTDKDAYISFQNDLFQGHRYPPAYYMRFSALAYSFENSFPLIRLGQANLWQPNSPSQTLAPQPDPYTGFLASWVGSRTFLELFGYFQIIAGWILATLGVAGVTGIIRTED